MSLKFSHHIGNNKSNKSDRANLRNNERGSKRRYKENFFLGLCSRDSHPTSKIIGNANHRDFRLPVERKKSKTSKSKKANDNRSPSINVRATQSPSQIGENAKFSSNYLEKENERRTKKPQGHTHKK